jgi:hypothetical protein
MLNARLLAGVGKDLFVFSLYSYYIFDGETIEQHDCVGLPDPYSSWSFTLSDNNTVYTIIDYNRVFRSVSPVVSSKETGVPIQIKLYPNPANDFISISISENDLKLFDSYEIIDMLGCCRGRSNEFNGQPISVNCLVPGMYTLVLKGNENIIGIEKFIRQ